jgi:hypothetical protein
LLSTPPRGDAVTFGYGVVAYSDTDSHRAVVAPSWAHSYRYTVKLYVYIVLAIFFSTVLYPAP